MLLTQLCGTLGTTVQSLVNRQESGSRTLDVLLQKIDGIIKQQQEAREAQDVMIAMVERPQPPFAGNGNQQSTLLNVDDDDDDVVDVDVDAGGDGGDAVAEGNTGRPVLPRNIHNTRMTMAKGRGMNATELLLPEPRQPSMSETFPSTWVEMQHEWTINDLQSFKHMKGKSWASRPNRMRYQKRMTAINQLRKFKQQVYNEAVTEKEVALALDRERVNRKMSMSMHIDYLHKNDNTIRRREPKKRKRNDGDINNNNHDT
jgi:hypothetical protein